MKVGRIVTYTGPMFSGKTSELARLIRREIKAKEFDNSRDFVVFNSAIDSRFGVDHICTHDQVRYDAHFIDKTKEMFDIYRKSDGINTVFVDEVMFFNSDVLDYLRFMVREGVDSYCFTLDMTSEGRPFPFRDGRDHIGALFAISNEVNKLTSICSKTGEPDANMTYALFDKKEDVAVGADEEYTAFSPEVWHEKVNWCIRKD